VYNDIAVGAVCSKLEEKDTKLNITNIHVLPKYRKLGVGSRLVDKAIEIAKKSGTNCKTVYMHVPMPIADEDLLKLFISNGFSKQEGDKDDYILVKTL
jgi:ribosomal protein S18 acetylase RimI-like enzyme